jgi:lysophospholipase L1-like esterase
MNLVSAVSPFQPVAAVAPQDWSLGFHYPSPTTFAMSLNAPSVFIGDSITFLWPLPINNQGISGQHAAEISARFSTDVLGQGYTRVIILAGTNDIWFPDSTSPYAINTILSMAELAQAYGIEPVLCLLPPIEPYTGNLNPQVTAFNANLTAVAAYHGFLLVDYYTPLLPVYPTDSVDGVHPDAAGYALMEAALSSVVTR